MNIIISNTSEKSLYRQITDQIKNNILRGELMPGDTLPSIRSLAKELYISVITTKRAYAELEKEGFIETVPGKGSFVTKQNGELLRDKQLKIIEEKMIALVVESRLLGISLAELQEMLQLLNEEVY
ncbi:GntR family transcriptional regulator [Peptococcaceae bacterium]|nr:GntR family transcriptional regulator [Peptococcaceae bacterium]